MTADKARDAAERVVAVCDVLAGLDRIPDTVLQRFPHQPWREIVAMRNFAAHQYDDLDPRRVWRTVTRDVPALRAYLADTVIPGLSR